MNTPLKDHDKLVAEYRQLTTRVMPEMARDPACNWPVKHDHCFQRIVLDTISGGVWYDHIPRPAYKHLDPDQAKRAVALCRDIIDGLADLDRLNAQSLVWRGKRPAV